MTRGVQRFLVIGMVLLGMLLLPIKVEAMELDMSDNDTLPIQEDGEGNLSLLTTENGINTYQFSKYGTFRTNVEMDSQGDKVYFDFDEALDYDLMRGSSLIEYKPGQELTEEGQYSLYIYPMDDNVIDFTEFNFFIGNPSSFQDVSNNDTEFQMIEKRVPLIAGIDYDKGCLTYSMNNKIVLWTTVPNQGVAVDGVVFSVAEGVTLSIELNDTKIVRSEDSTYTEPGSYHCMLSTYELSQETGIVTYTCEYDIVLIKEFTNAIHIINAPEGYLISNVTFNKRQIEESDHYLWTNKDGLYDITFTSEEIDGLTYHIRFTKDTIAPFINFDKNVYEKIVSPPISFCPDEDGEKITVYEKNLLLNLSEYKIVKPGNYSITIEDTAGNTRNYTFFVNNVFKFVTLRSIIVLVVIVIIVTLWIIRTRKKQYRVL